MKDGASCSGLAFPDCLVLSGTVREGMEDALGGFGVLVRGFLAGGSTLSTAGPADLSIRSEGVYVRVRFRPILDVDWALVFRCGTGPSGAAMGAGTAGAAGPGMARGVDECILMYGPGPRNSGMPMGSPVVIRLRSHPEY